MVSSEWAKDKRDQNSHGGGDLGFWIWEIKPEASRFPTLSGAPRPGGHGSATASLGPTGMKQQGVLTLGGLQYWGGGGGRTQPSQHGSDSSALSKLQTPSNWDFSFIENQTVLR